MKHLKPAEREKTLAFMMNEIENSISSRDFQREFFESLQEQFERTRTLSDKQVESLQRIYDRVTDARLTFRR